MRVWRLTQARHAETAFTGIGTKEFGSRWVPQGYAAVYTSEHISTSILETLVHMEVSHFGQHYVVIGVDVPDDLPMDVVQADSLPGDWAARFEDPQLHQVGTDWLERGESAALIVPSAVVPLERNVILNPEHPDFALVTIQRPEPFALDGRLATAIATRSSS